MVRKLTSIVREARPAVVEFKLANFGRVTVKVIPMDVVVYEVGLGYRVDIGGKVEVEPEKRLYKAYLCSPNTQMMPVEFTNTNYGYLSVELESIRLEVYIEILRVYASETSSDIDGAPCVNVIWTHGIRMQLQR